MWFNMGSNKDDGRSVTGFIVYLQGVPIAWKSKQQSHVSLSSSEAEYIAISNVVKEILFVKQILEDMKVKLQLPISVFYDNTGAIQMVRNNASEAGTRHINVRYHFVRELHGETIILYHRPSEDN